MPSSQPLDFFSEPWLQAWQDEIASSDAYRQAAATWEGTLIFRLRSEAASPMPHSAVFLDLWHGTCREARFSNSDDEADYIMEAALPVWKSLLSGQAQPIMALMTGKLKLVRGSLAALTPYVQASQELVAAAGRVPTQFPDA